jgi:5-methylthioadenosine/S-adenosylhomocysteine deaminase
LKILLKNALILKNAFSDFVKENIFIENGKIVEIGKFQRQADKVYDLSGKLIMPGFVNAHTHAAMTLMRGVAEDVSLEEWLFKKIFPIEDKLTPEDVYIGTMIAQMEMARKGVVAYVDMYFHCEAVVQAAIDFGMKALITRGLTNQSGSDNGRLRQNIEYFEKFNGKDGLVFIGFGPHAPYSCSLDYLDRVATVANELGAPVTIHLYESEKETYSLKEILKTKLSECRVIFAHCVHLKESDIELLAKESFFVAHSPTSNLKLANGIAPVSKMLEKNIQVCLGTDGAASNNTLDIWHEMRLASLLQKARDPVKICTTEALSMATLTGAKASGLTSGSLDTGYDADLIVLDIEKPWYLPLEQLKSHLIHSANSLDVYATMVKGRWVYFNGVFPTVDESEIKNRFEGVVQRLIDIGN